MAGLGRINQAKLKQLRLRVETDHNWYPGMRRLKIKGKELDNIPRELFTISDIEILDLSPERQSCLFYRLTFLPSYIGRMVNLKVLMLDTNELDDLPAELGLLNNLERLSLSNNNLTTLPDEFGKMENMLSLHMANNKFALFPTQILFLTNLEFLDMCDNQIPIIPEDIKKLTKLESLMLFLNKLEVLPDGICELENLKSLWVGNNKIKRLPKNFTNLSKLDWGQRLTSSSAVDGNPLEYPPIHICRQGIKSIGMFFEAMEPSNHDENTNSETKEN